MNKKSLLLIVVLVVVFLLASSSIVAAQGGGVIDCDLYIEYDEYAPEEFYWFGTLTGDDCDVEGTIRFDGVPAEYSTHGKTMHFVELFVIKPDDGGEIRGKNWGVWNLKTLKFRANGWVTSTSSQWDHLLGSHYHEMGVTTGGPTDDLPIGVRDGAWAKITP
jgi:hypothetical protein